MAHSSQPEAWLTGPVAGYEPLLMPVVHALLQTRTDVQRLIVGVDDLWARPGGAASIAFHLQHMAGTIDRLLTYARGESLTDEQWQARKREGVAGDAPPTLDQIVRHVDETIDHALEQLRSTPAGALLDPRMVGRAALPSTVLGLLFHVAEHTTRHAGQAITTAKILAGLRTT